MRFLFTEDNLTGAYTVYRLRTGKNVKFNPERLIIGVSSQRFDVKVKIHERSPLTQVDIPGILKKTSQCIVDNCTIY